MTITFKRNGAAFGNNSAEKDDETARILRELAVKIRHGEEPRSVWDVNGNKIGTVKYDK